MGLSVAAFEDVAYRDIVVNLVIVERQVGKRQAVELAEELFVIVG